MLDAVSAAVVLADEAGRVIRMNSYAHRVFWGRPATLAEVGLEARAGEQTVRRMDASTVTASVSVTTIDPGLRVLTVTEWHGHREYGRLDLNAFGVGTWDWHIPPVIKNFDRRWLGDASGYGEGELDYDLGREGGWVHPDDRDRSMRPCAPSRRRVPTPTAASTRCRHHDGALRGFSTPAR